MKNDKTITIADLYRTHGAMVFRRCLKLLRNEQDALDCTHDVFISINKRVLDLQYPSNYLYRIATNHCLNRIRDKKCHSESNIDELVSVLAVADETENSIILQSIMERLFKGHPESTRTIALLHLYDGYTLEEVAEMVNMSLSGVRKRLRLLKESAIKKGLHYE